MDELNFEFSDIMRFLARGIVLALPLAILAAGVTYLVTRRAVPVYEATASMLLTEPNSSLESAALNPPPLEPSNYSQVAKSNELIEDTLAALQVPDPTPELIRQFGNDINVSVPGNRQDKSRIMQVSYRSSSPETAQRGANALAEALRDWESNRAGESINTRIRTLNQQVAALDEAIDGLRLRGDLASEAELESRIRLREQQVEELYFASALQSSAQGLLSSVQPAELPREPVEPNPTRNAVLAALLAVFGVYGASLLRDALNTRLTGAAEVGSETGLQVLGEIPRAPNRQLERDAIGYLRTNLLFGSGTGAKSFLITSAAEGEGKSSVALNLAQSFARNAQRTLLIDADLRRHSLTEEIAPPDTKRIDLHQVLQQPGSQAPVPIAMPGGQHFDFVPSYRSTEDSLELLTQGFRSCMQDWLEFYDVVVVDSAPVLAVADSLAIAPHCDSTILVSGANKTRREDLLSAKRKLEGVGASVLGVAVTQVDPKALPSYYGYAKKAPQKA